MIIRRQKLVAKKASRYAVGSGKTKFTVPQPFALATEKLASYGNLPYAAEFDNITSGNKPSHVGIVEHPTSAKQNPTISSIVQRKPLQPDNKKRPDEDNYLAASRVMASARKFRTTVTSAPVFKSNERAERRKEFYSKLEEKHQALETEKTQYAQRTKEETEAAIRQLRKSLLFKASPMPSFYNDGPPQKVELKKPPPTRAISPRLGRRKYNPDAKSLDKGTQEARHGFPGCRDTPITSTHRKFGINVQNHTPSC